MSMSEINNINLFSAAPGFLFLSSHPSAFILLSTLFLFDLHLEFSVPYFPDGR
jgi:hypothetical protein